MMCYLKALNNRESSGHVYLCVNVSLRASDFAFLVGAQM